MANERSGSGPIRVLLVEDTEEDAVFTRAMLAQAGGFDVAWVATYEAGLAAIRSGRHDVCVLDYQLGDRTGVELLHEVGVDGSIPIILLTGKGGREVDVASMAAGAAEYLEKGQLEPKLMERAIRHALERSRMLVELRESRAFLLSTLDALSARIAIVDADGMIIAVNAAWRSFAESERLGSPAFGVGSRYKDVCQSLSMCAEEDADAIVAAIDAIVKPSGRPFYRECASVEPRPSRWFSVRLTRFTESSAGRVVVAHEDITQRKLAERRLEETLYRIEQSHDDLLSILSRLRSGTLMTDPVGRVTFVSPACTRLLGRRADEIVGQPWEWASRLEENELLQIRTMAERPALERVKVPVRLDSGAAHPYWVDIEVQDDPRDPRRKILFFYDVTEVRDLRRLLDGRAQFEDLVGKSAAMKLVYKQIRQLAEVDSTVLIEGATGTGKELVARALHYTSMRKDAPFVALNCAGLTDSILASQLFGHKRGAFTGAIADHRGLFEAAQGGTLFLDEIGDVPPAVQASLLRVVQEREIVRLGENAPRKIDVRIVAATNRDLAREVELGNFRLDLLYRIRVARIWLPPLSRRREDVPLLVASFLAKMRAALGKSVEIVSNDAMRLLMSHDWPGNVRELEGAVEYAVVRSEDSILRPADLPPEVVASAQAAPGFAPDPRRGLPARGPEPGLGPASEYRDESQRIRAALARSKGNRTEAARLLGVSRATLYRRLANLGKPD